MTEEPSIEDLEREAQRLQPRGMRGDWKNLVVGSWVIVAILVVAMLLFVRNPWATPALAIEGLLLLNLVFAIGVTWAE